MKTSRYYYSKLSDADKAIYNAIYNGIKECKEFVKAPNAGVNNNKVGFIYRCVLWDNPYFFTIGEHAMQNALSADGKRIRITAFCDPLTAQERQKKVAAEINCILSAIGQNKLSDFQKEVFVHDYIVNNISYDDTAGDNGTRHEPYTIYGVFVERKAVSEGIAKAVKLLLNMLDVKCIVVDGTVQDNPHAWNMVKIKGFEYNLDATMDLVLAKERGYMSYDFFNFRTIDDASRTLRNGYLLPECIAIEYNYVVYAGGFVSNFDRLVNYMKMCLSKKKPCMYIKINRNVNGDFGDLRITEFWGLIEKAHKVATRETGVQNHVYSTGVGDMGVFTVAIAY